jgi:hypothetical protein
MHTTKSKILKLFFIFLKNINGTIIINKIVKVMAGTIVQQNFLVALKFPILTLNLKP